MDNEEDLYPCVGLCTPDPDSGYCLGCGRPPMASPESVAEAAPANPPGQRTPNNSAPDSPSRN